MAVALSPRTARNISWAEKHLRIPDADKAGQPLVIADYMRKDFELIWGNPHGTRNIIISRARKNAKTVEMAILFLIYLIGPEAKANSQLYSVANSKEQAKTLYKYICQMIRFNPRLDDALTILADGKIENRHHGITYEALSSKPSTAHGKNPLLVCFDELGQWSAGESELYNIMTSGSVVQGEPLFAVISTQAPNDFALLSQLIDQGLETMALPDGHPEKDHQTIVRLDTAPMDLEPYSLEAIRAANPAYDLFMSKSGIAKAIRDSKRSPSALAAYRNLHLNQRVATRNNFVAYDVWKANAGPNDSDWTGCPVYCGMDLSTTLDLTAFVMMARVNGIWEVRTYAWLPEEGLEEKSRADKTTWDLYAEQGVLLTTPGPTVDYEIVSEKLFSLCQGLDIRGIAFDKHRFNDMKRALARAGFTPEQLEGDERIFFEHPQNAPAMSSALNALESMLIRKEIAHANHTILGLCAHNAIVYEDSNQNRKLVKKYASHGGRIDAMVALVMAANLANQEYGPEETPGSYLDEEGATLVWLD